MEFAEERHWVLTAGVEVKRWGPTDSIQPGTWPPGELLPAVFSDYPLPFAAFPLSAPDLWRVSSIPFKKLNFFNIVRLNS